MTPSGPKRPHAKPGGASGDRGTLRAVRPHHAAGERVTTRERERERIHRSSALQAELRRYRIDLVRCGREVARIFLLPPEQRPATLSALQDRYLRLVHRHDQLAAEIAELLNGGG